MLLRVLYLPQCLGDRGSTEITSSQALQEVQQKLRQMGLYKGDITGVIDQGTRDAVARFQEEANLAPTGAVTPLVYCRLNQAQEQEVTLRQQIKERANFTLARANILIAKSSRQLTLFDGNSPLRHFPVAIGKPATPTPDGNYRIITKVVNPGGMLGTRWLGLSNPGYGIHGTSAPWLIGQMVSHGCIRMYNSNVEELFPLVNVGTPVYIRE